MRPDVVGRQKTGSEVVPAGFVGRRPVGCTSGGYMRAKVTLVFANVAELGLFFAAAVALCLGLLGLR
jgi:hypothetical protein